MWGCSHPNRYRYRYRDRYRFPPLPTQDSKLLTFFLLSIPISIAISISMPLPISKESDEGWEFLVGYWIFDCSFQVEGPGCRLARPPMASPKALAGSGPAAARGPHSRGISPAVLSPTFRGPFRRLNREFLPYHKCCSERTCCPLFRAPCRTCRRGRRRARRCS